MPNTFYIISYNIYGKKKRATDNILGQNVWDARSFFFAPIVFDKCEKHRETFMLFIWCDQQVIRSKWTINIEPVSSM